MEDGCLNYTRTCRAVFRAQSVDEYNQKYWEILGKNVVIDQQKIEVRPFGVHPPSARALLQNEDIKTSRFEALLLRS